jgi:putative hydrolase of the HAD superfamily
MATNAADSDEPDIRAALRRAALEPLIDEVYCYRRLGCKKPSPEFFRAVLADLGLPPGQVIMVGDSLEGDVLGAVRAGLRAVWFHPAGPETIVTPHIRTLRDFRELPVLLADLAPDLASPDRTPFTTDEHG